MTKADSATPREVEAQMRLYGAGGSATPKTAGRFPTVTIEVWLAKRLGDRTLFDGVTTAEQRRERVRQRIIADGRHDEIAGKRAADGAEETFERLYGVGL